MTANCDDGGTNVATSREELCQTVVLSIASETGTDPTSLPPITRSIDPDVLNDFRDGDDTKTLSFEYHGHEVTVTGDGEIRLRPLP